MDKTKLIKNLMFVKAGIWVVFAGFHFARNTKISFWLANLMLIDAVIFGLIGWKIDQCKSVYYFALIFIGLNILLTIFDQMGIYDFIILGIDSVVLVFLLILKKNFSFK